MAIGCLSGSVGRTRENITLIFLSSALFKYCRINKKREKSTLSAYFHVIFSWNFRCAGRKSCIIFWQNFQRDVFAVFFCNKMKFWHIFGSFKRGSITVGRMDINWPSLLIINATVNSFQASDRRVRLYTEQKWKRYTRIVCHLYAQWCKPVKQMKVYLNVQRLGYACSRRFTDVVTRKHLKGF